MKATIINKLTGERIEVRSTTRHPSCNYGQAVWVDRDNNAYLQVYLHSNELLLDASNYKVEITERDRQRFELGQKLAAIRCSKGITVRGLAQQAGITPSNLSNIEQGNYCAGVDIIQRICKALGAKLTITT